MSPNPKPETISNVQNPNFQNQNTELVSGDHFEFWSFCNKSNFGAQHLHAFALRLMDCPCLGFTQLVTLLCARFSSGLLVRLYPGWIIQLICASFAWRTHFNLFSNYFNFFILVDKLLVSIQNLSARAI